MNWYNYVACFFAGAFLANVVPHFFHSISGDRFPTPFARPLGRGLSSPTVKVVWAWINLGGDLIANLQITAPEQKRWFPARRDKTVSAW